MPSANEQLSIGQLAQLACVTEVGARKVGNVHPGASFADATWLDFVISAAAISPILDAARDLGVGQTVLRCVSATRAVTGSNTNLGMILLLAPLCAAASRAGNLDVNTQLVLAALDDRDAAAVYEAIRLANPGGLGRADRGDVAQPPSMSLVEAMKLAADRDAVARQYAEGFIDVLGRVSSWLARNYAMSDSLEMAIVLAHLQLMATEPDSLIRRKCGEEVAAESQRRAALVLEAAGRDPAVSERLMRGLDAWLREDGNRRNPGTSADLVAAGLFVCFRLGTIGLPFRWAPKPA